MTSRQKRELELTDSDEKTYDLQVAQLDNGLKRIKIDKRKPVIVQMKCKRAEVTPECPAYQRVILIAETEAGLNQTKCHLQSLSSKVETLEMVITTEEKNVSKYDRQIEEIEAKLARVKEGRRKSQREIRSARNTLTSTVSTIIELKTVKKMHERNLKILSGKMKVRNAEGKLI